MAKRTFQQATWSPAAIADTTALATAQFMSLGAANATQLLKVIEIYIGGKASASTIEILQFARDSTLVVSPTALAAPNSDGPISTFTNHANRRGSRCLSLPLPIGWAPLARIWNPPPGSFPKSRARHAAFKDGSIALEAGDPACERAAEDREPPNRRVR
jgi:hypothetical protein